MKLQGHHGWEEVRRAVGALAHEKWFVDDPGAFDADWAFASRGRRCS